MAWTVSVRREKGVNIAHVRAVWNAGLADQFAFDRTLDSIEGGAGLRDFKRDAVAARNSASTASTDDGVLATRIEGFLNG